MQEERKKVLMVEDDFSIANIMTDILENPSVPGKSGFRVEHVAALGPGLQRLKAGNIDVVLLDLSLPDSSGFETFRKVRASAPEIPVVILSGLADESMAMQAVQEGAQDYLMKGQLDVQSIVRALHYAIERAEQQKKLKAMSFIDELTGVYNRRGFTRFVEQQILLSNRTKRGLCLLFVDLDGLKAINDRLGHQKGDVALQETADVLRTTFRRSDVVGRIGGDEFLILMIEGLDASDEMIKLRLQKNIDELNHRKDSDYRISLSIGVVRYHPDQPCTLNELIELADAAMYQEKRRKIAVRKGSQESAESSIKKDNP